MKNQLLLSLCFLFGISTIAHSQECGSVFTDSGGASANYANNSNNTRTICPANPGDVVTVTFTAFSTEPTFDALYVYNGNNSAAALMLASTNGAGNVAGGLAGGYWGTTIPGPFISSSADGCLTFVFRSNGSTTYPGWVANVSCGPPSGGCEVPLLLNATAISATSATINWQEAGSATNWETYLAPAGTPAPTSTSLGMPTSTSVPFVFSGLSPDTCYTFYVRSICSATEHSAWSAGYNFCTMALPPSCGGQFTDNGGANASYSSNLNSTTTLCPSSSGDMVTVTFTSFNTEPEWDGLYVFDGNSTSAPQITSQNAVGNGPLSLPGAFWGSTIPGPFTAANPSGCLTFNFRSDSTGQQAGWVANVTCAPAPSCTQPTNVTVTSTAIGSVTLGWAGDNSVSSWEIAALPIGSYPNASTLLQTVTTNPATISGLVSGNSYSFYVRANCSGGGHSFWSARTDAATSIINDACETAIEIPITGHKCTQLTSGSLAGATASSQTLGACVGTPNDDVWFKFTAADVSLNLALSNIAGSTSDLNFAVYSGSCGSLTPFFCSPEGQVAAQLNGLTIGTPYYLRVYSNAATAQTTTFGICITVASTCANSESVCGINNYINTTGVPSLGTIGCLMTTPNPTFLNLKISSTGPVNLTLTQSSIGSATPNLDVDYVAWGPFTSQSEACSAISSGQEPGIGVPVTTTTGCSYSANSIENLNIANAQAGQYYVILVTNFSNQVGSISITQSNVSDVGAGSYDCSGVRLNAFLDSNTNGIQDNGEPNFPLGQFHYEVNNDGNQHAVQSSTGSYILYDPVPTNIYSLSYTINGDYTAQYSAPSGFTNVSVSSGTMTTYNFPVVASQNYSDLGVTIVPQNSPRAGTNYNVKIVYTNNGNLTLPSGSLTFHNNVGTTITNISQSGTTAITNGFTYAFTNLAPFESRSIIVTIAVPPLPLVFLGQLLTDTVAVTPPSGDVVADNDSDASTQGVIGAYDPNDKVEGHGEKILFSSFTSNDYLEYTIRFENNGTAGALNIKVIDVLDSKLDESSLVMLSASHPYTLDRLDNGLTWSFDNIQLPVSVTNTNIGKGFVKFKIKPKPGYAVGDIIPNAAEIYFDSNPAIVTNTFNTQFVETLGNELFTENSIILYPNPATTTINIALQNSAETIAKITVYDVLGKNVSQVSGVASNQSVIDVRQLSKGIYMVEITTENNLKQIKKLVIQ